MNSAHEQARDDQRPVRGLPNQYQRRDHRNGHAGRRDPVTANRGPGTGQAHQAVDEQREGDDVRDRDHVVHRAASFVSAAAGSTDFSGDFSGGFSADFSGDFSVDRGFLPLNMPSMRSVTTNPPTTFSVPNTTATNRMICA